MHTASPYEIETVETCRTPHGLAQDDWCRYILANSQSRVVGRYRGSLSQARSNAQSLADKLNRRLSNGYSPWAAQSRKSKKMEAKAAEKAGS
jgi:hypothetical protein